MKTNNKWLLKIKNGTDSLKELWLIYGVSAVVVALLFALFEQVALVDAFWWTFVTGLTIGYGDIYPHTTAGQILTVLWAHYMVLFILPLFIGRVLSSMMDNKNEFSDLEQKQMLGILQRLDKKTTK